MRLRLTVAAATATLLGSIGLYPLFDSTRWVWPGLGAIIMVAATGLLTRRFRLHAAICLAAGFAALLVYVTLLHAAGEAVAGIIPTPSSVTKLAELVGDGGQVINRYAAPVPLVPGISLLATLGIGLVALTIDFLAVQLRHAAPAGLPLLAMFSVPAAVREESISWVAFLLGAVGFLGLLLADSREQVSGWGRPVLGRRWSPGTSTRERPDSSALAVTGHRIGLTAVAIAVLVPAIMPGLQPRSLFGFGPGGQGSGSRTVTTPDALVSLKRELTRQDDAVVLTYRTNDTGRPDYLRMYALDRFDGDRWTYSAVEGATVREHGIPPAPGLRTAPVRRVSTQVKVDEQVRDMSFLPMPYPPTEVDIKGDWRVNAPSLMVYSLRDAAGGREYRVDSLRVLPTAEQLDAAEVQIPPGTARDYLNVPERVPQSIRDLAAEQTAGAVSPYDKAMRLQDWFTRSGEFTYDLSRRSPQRVSDLVDFLTISKSGYCEQFAATMALLARILDIPARVAMGYTAGEQVSDGSWVVRSADAHAWPELYFEGVGWVRFEPTPSGAAGQGSASTPDYAAPVAEGNQAGPGGEAAPSPSASDGASPGASPGATPGRIVDEPGQFDDAAGVPTEGTDQGLPTGWTAAILLTLMVLVTPMGVRMLTRRRRWALAAPAAAAPLGVRALSPRRRETPASADDTARDATRVANAAWIQLRTDAIDHGLPWRASDSPRAAARRLIDHLRLGDPATASITRIARAEELARYSRTPDSPGSLHADSRLVRKAFADAVSWKTRWRARLAPPSTMTALRDAGGRALEAFDLLDTLGSRLSQAIRKR